MGGNGCAGACAACRRWSRREFLALTGGAWAAATVLPGCRTTGTAHAWRRVTANGPGARYVPTVRACFVRRRGEYGLRWPGQVYDGEAARRAYAAQALAAAGQLGLNLDLRPEPLFTAAEADAWLAETVAKRPDGLLVMLLDRQDHAWPTAVKAIDTKLPTVVFSPLGTSFTVNTEAPSKKPNSVILSTDDFREVEYGLRMLWAGARIRHTRCLVIRGKERADRELPHLGLALRHIPAATFLEEYQRTPADGEVQAMADDLLRRARGRRGATMDDVLNGIRSYVVARTLLEREECDAITMDCLGALGPSKVSLPCIAWSRMNDDGIPAACEADIGAMAAHVLVQNLFARPGFQQDPVAETARQAVIGAHCSCPTRLNGFGAAPEPYDIVHHHGERDATVRTVWRVGQRVTCLDVLPGSSTAPTKLLFAVGEVLENVAVPPAGGCVVSVMVAFEGASDVLAFPGFHQVFVYGDFRRQLRQYCQLVGLEPVPA